MKKTLFWSLIIAMIIGMLAAFIHGLFIDPGAVAFYAGLIGLICSVAAFVTYRAEKRSSKN